MTGRNAAPCEECGLPIPICNALAAYSRAIRYRSLGRGADAQLEEIAAKDCYDTYLAEYREQNLMYR